MGSGVLSDFARQGASIDALQLYIDEICRYPILTREEEREFSRLSLAAEAAKKLLNGQKAEPNEMRCLLVQELPETTRERLLAWWERGDGLVLDVGDVDALGLVVERGHQAQQKLIVHNLRFVFSVAGEYASSGIPLRDLVSAGNEGLIHAVRKYDGDRGVPFVHYAAFWIKQRLQKYVAEYGGPTRIPPSRAGTVQRVRKVASRLMQWHVRPPTAQEVADETGYDPREVDEILKLLQAPVELDSPIKGDPVAAELRNYFGESIEEARERETHQVSRLAMRAEIEKALSVLTEREALVIRLYYGLESGEEMSLEEIGRLLGVSRERVRQIQKAAIAKIREAGVIRDVRDD